MKIQRLFLCILCLTLCGCDEIFGPQVEVCESPTIRVEMGGTILKLKRDEVFRIHVPNPERKGNLHRYLDVVSDCDVAFQEGVVKIGSFKPPIGYIGRLEIETRQDRRGLYFEGDYANRVERYKERLKTYDNGVLHAFTGKESGFYVLTETEGLEINGDPIAFKCEPALRCGTDYIHPSGLRVVFDRTGSVYAGINGTEPSIFKHVQTVSKKIDSLIMKEGE